MGKGRVNEPVGWPISSTHVTRGKSSRTNTTVWTRALPLNHYRVHHTLDHKAMLTEGTSRATADRVGVRLCSILLFDRFDILVSSNTWVAGETCASRATSHLSHAGATTCRLCAVPYSTSTLNRSPVPSPFPPPPSFVSTSEL